VVLVVTLAIPQDGEAGQFDTEFWPAAVAVLLTTAVYETAEEAALLARVYVVRVAPRTLVFRVDEGNPQRWWEGLQHPLGMFQLRGIEVRVLLHGHEARETNAGVPRLVCPQAAIVVTLGRMMTIDGIVVEGHACHRPPERLVPQGGPDAEFLPLVIAVAPPIAPATTLPLAGLLTHAACEGPELARVTVLQPRDKFHVPVFWLRWHNGLHHAATCRPFSRPVNEELVLAHQDGLTIVGYQDRDAWDVRCTEWPG